MTDNANLPAPTAGGTVAAFVPQTFDEAFRMGSAFHAAGMAPKGLNSAEQCTGVIIAGMEIGLTPYVSLQSFANINGRTSLWGDAIPAILWSRGFKLKEWFENESPDYPDNMVAKCLVIRPDGTEVVGEFSVADAKEGKLFDMKDGPWKTAKKRMLKMRARAFAARDGASDVLKGFPVYEEVVDYQDIEDVTDKPGRAKRNLKDKLKPQEEAPPEVEATLEAEDGTVIDHETGEVLEEGRSTAPQEVDGALIAEGDNGSSASATNASTNSPAPEASGREEDLAWWQKTEITEGVAKPGEVYRLASDEAGEDGKVPTYADGAPFSRAAEKGSLALNVYRQHSPTVAPPAEPEEQDTGEADLPPPDTILGKIARTDSWLTVKAIYVEQTKTPGWAEADEEDRDLVKIAIRRHVEKLVKAGDPVRPQNDPTYFLIWMAGEEEEDGAVEIETALADLEKSEKFLKLKPDAQDRLRDQVGARIRKIRGE